MATSRFWPAIRRWAGWRTSAGFVTPSGPAGLSLRLLRNSVASLTFASHRSDCVLGKRLFKIPHLRPGITAEALLPFPKIHHGKSRSRFEVVPAQRQRHMHAGTSPGRKRRHGGGSPFVAEVIEEDFSGSRGLRPLDEGQIGIALLDLFGKSPGKRLD